MSMLTQQTEPFAYPSINYGVAEDVYRLIPAINSSGIKKMLDNSIAHYQWEKDHPQGDTESTTRGTLFHALALEPDKELLYRGIPDDCNNASNANKANTVRRYMEILGLEDPPRVAAADPKTGKALAEGVRLSLQIDALRERIDQEGIRVVPDATLAKAKLMRDNLLSVPFASAVLGDGGDSEVTLLWVDKETGLRCKARVDYLPAAHRLLADLKSIGDGGWDSVFRSIRNYRYPIQAAHYLDGAKAVGLPHDRFVFFFSEDSGPCHSRFIELAENTLERARHKRRVWMRRYADAVASGIYPSYQSEVETIDLPDYAI